MKLEKLSQEYLRQILLYDSDTGHFYWNIDKRPFVRKGDLAGFTERSGYRSIRISGVAYKAHRLAYLYVFGKWPIEVDHINCIKSDNRLCNLREATRSQNVSYAKSRSNTSGIRGVSWHNNAWRVRVQVNGKRIVIGSYVTLEAAERAAKDARLKLHGEFANECNNT